MRRLLLSLTVLVVGSAIAADQLGEITVTAIAAAQQAHAIRIAK
jgi:ABC-type proline/glycine betaine transport system permease subunit